MKHVTHSKKLLNEKEAAERLGMSVFFLRRARSEGNRDDRTPAPPFVKIGRSVRYIEADVDDFIVQNRRECL
jgi:predicted DNA-binding transcriptional regulator AlpA